MKISFCDLCGQPIKHRKYKLIIASYYEQPVYHFDEEADKQYYKQKGFVEDKELEICETCKYLLDRIFEQRMIGVLKIAEDIKKIYGLKTKEPQHEINRNKKEKRKKKG